MHLRSLAVVLALVALPGRSVAAEPEPATDAPSEKPPSDPKPAVAEPGDLAARLAKLEQENEKLRDELDKLKEDQQFMEERVKDVLPVKSKITGYLDFGFFYVSGDGSGIRSDTGHARFPEYRGVVPDSWVFMGDPLSTAVNSRGEPADTSESRAITFNPIGNRGKASFIANALNFQLFHGIGEHTTVNGSFDLVPRGRDVSNPNGHALGDFLDVKLAYVEHRIVGSTAALSLYAGKFDSVLGIEYRRLESPDRTGITPSLICRYTCGRPLGLKARLKLFDEKLVLNGAVTNGTHFQEGFPFYNEIDKNNGKTAAGRLSWMFPVSRGIELGVSGAYGAQDLQTSERIHQWHYGFDLRAELGDFDLRAEFVEGRAPGRTENGEPRCGLAPCIKYKGAYGQIAYRVSNWFTPYTRVDWRDALHESGASFVYVSELLRTTIGSRLEIGESVIVKAEYILNRELGRLPQFANDVFTSSLVAKF